MSEWTVIDYRQYWDVPREFVVRGGKNAYYFESPFDEALDDYTPDFYVYRLPAEIAGASIDHWSEFRRLGTRLADIPVRELRFRTDSIPGGLPTRRYLRYVHNRIFEILRENDRAHNA